jgi:hypothetical protein
MLYRPYAYTKQWWNDNDRNKTEILVDKPAPGLVFPNKFHIGYSGAKAGLQKQIIVPIFLL